MSSLRPAFIILAAALLIIGVYAVGLRGAADVHYTSARLLFAAADKGRRAATEGELYYADASLRAALALEPSNPLFVEQLGRTLELRALHWKPDAPEAREFLRKALAQYRTAALMRPGSPFIWAAIAATKLRLEEMDFEFYGSLQRADRLGPWEPAVQLALADVGLSSWRLLAPSAKTLVAGAIGRALPRQEKEVRRIAAAHGTLPQFCAHEVTRRGGAAPLCVKK